MLFFFFKQKTAYEIVSRDWSSDVCSSDLSESIVLDQLLAYRQGKTTILISHRPQVIKRADQIVLLEAGQLQLQGTPSELLNIPGEHLDYLIS